MAQARSEAFYREHGVPDTVHGRFEMIVLHVALVVARLGLEGDAGQETGRAILEAFVADMDDACRRLGIGDMGVPRHVKKAAAAVLERGNAYRAAIADSSAGDPLATVLASEIWREPAERAPAPRADRDTAPSSCVRCAGSTRTAPAAPPARAPRARATRPRSQDPAADWPRPSAPSTP